MDCNQGYEWWLAEQAHQRNPNIKLYGLSWDASGWTDPSGKSFYSTNTINHLMDWLGCAKQHHLTIDYLGGWNENGTGGHGYGSIKVVAADNGWNVADDMANDPAFKTAVDIVGVPTPSPPCCS